MNPWLWRAGIAAGATATTLGLQYWWRRAHRALQPRPTDDLFPDELTVMGHRGAAAVAPENTMAAFAVPARLGLPFELDVRLCGTGEVIVLHDDALDRTTNGAGLAAAAPWSTLRGLDAGRWFEPPFLGQRVPSLDAVLATLGGASVINIEIKQPASVPDKARLVHKVTALVQAHDIVDRVMVSSFDPDILALAYAEAPSIRRGLIIGTDVDRPRYARWLAPHAALATTARPDLLMVDRRSITQAFVSTMKARGFRVFAWTVNDVDEARRLVTTGIDGLITDDPERILDTVRTVAQA